MEGGQIRDSYVGFEVMVLGEVHLVPDRLAETAAGDLGGGRHCALL